MTYTKDVLAQVVDFLKVHNFRFDQHNPRPWGSYEVAISLDGVGWAVLADLTFGSAIYEGAAAAIALTDAVYYDKFDRNTLNQWLGEGRADELRKIIKG